jgi:hypothetical protein
MGSRLGTCTCGFPKKEGIPCKHMMALVKVGTINRLTRLGIMPHKITTTQWSNQFLEDATFHTHITLKLIDSTGQYPILSHMGRTPEEWSPEDGNVQEKSC